MEYGEFTILPLGNVIGSIIVPVAPEEIFVQVFPRFPPWQFAQTFKTYIQLVQTKLDNVHVRIVHPPHPQPPHPPQPQPPHELVVVTLTAAK